MHAKPASSWLVEVVTSWGDTVLSAQHLRAGERFVIGANGRASSSDFPEGLNTWALAGVSVDGRCWVELPPSTRFAVESTAPATERRDDDGPQAFERSAERGEAFELVEGLRVRCQIGSLVFAVRMASDERVAISPAKDPAWRAALAAAVAVVGATLANFEHHHRAFDGELVARPREAREAYLRGLIERSIARDDASSAAQRVLKAPKRRSYVRAYSCFCRFPSHRVYAGAIPPGPVLSPFGPYGEDLRQYGIHALVVRRPPGEDIAFAGLVQSSFEPFPPFEAAWDDASSLASWPFGVGFGGAFDDRSQRAAVRLRIEDRAHDGPSDARIAATERLAPALRRCYTHALRANGARAGAIVFELDYDASRRIDRAELTRDSVGDRSLSACVERVITQRLARSEHAEGRERLIADFSVEPREPRLRSFFEPQ